MANSSHMNSPRLSWVSSHLTLAEAILELQVRVNAITRELALRPKPRSGPRCRPINWKSLTEALTALREVLATPAAQMLATGLLPLLAGIAKWFLRWLTG